MILKRILKANSKFNTPLPENFVMFQNPKKPGFPGFMILKTRKPGFLKIAPNWTPCYKTSKFQNVELLTVTIYISQDRISLKLDPHIYRFTQNQKLRKGCF